MDLTGFTEVIKLNSVRRSHICEPSNRAQMQTHEESLPSTTPTPRRLHPTEVAVTRPLPTPGVPSPTFSSEILPVVNPSVCHELIYDGPQPSLTFRTLVRTSQTSLPILRSPGMEQPRQIQAGLTKI